jgi:cysteinyl-tRNA synthetase
MSMEYLGETLDIHGGGLDLQFPHHENELAQSESFTGKPFARVWMHNGLLKMGHAKMAGSVGNVVNVADLLAKHHPETVRFLLLSTHYRSPIEYSDERLNEIARALQGFYRFFERYRRIAGETFYNLTVKNGDEAIQKLSPDLRDEIEPLWKKFHECMSDDFNTGGAVGVLFEILSVLNRYVDRRSLEAPPAGVEDIGKHAFRSGVLVLRQLGNLLGLFWEPVALPKAGDDQLANGLMQLLIDLRAEARKAKNFALADQIRKRLGELNVTLEDRPGGKTDWRLGGP